MTTIKYILYLSTEYFTDLVVKLQFCLKSLEKLATLRQDKDRSPRKLSCLSFADFYVDTMFIAHGIKTIWYQRSG